MSPSTARRRRSPRRSPATPRSPGARWRRPCRRSRPGHCRHRRGLPGTSRARWHRFPDVPTTAEAGYPQIEGDSWVGLLAPAGTPNEIIGPLQREITAIIALPDVKERLPALGFEAVGSTPEE